MLTSRSQTKKTVYQINFSTKRCLFILEAKTNVQILQVFKMFCKWLFISNIKTRTNISCRYNELGLKQCNGLLFIRKTG